MEKLLCRYGCTS